MILVKEEHTNPTSFQQPISTQQITSGHVDTGHRRRAAPPPRVAEHHFAFSLWLRAALGRLRQHQASEDCHSLQKKCNLTKAG